jgi:hypothetical protein
MPIVTVKFELKLYRYCAIVVTKRYRIKIPQQEVMAIYGETQTLRPQGRRPDPIPRADAGAQVSTHVAMTGTLRGGMWRVRW